MNKTETAKTVASTAAGFVVVTLALNTINSVKAERAAAAADRAHFATYYPTSRRVAQTA